MVEIESPDSGQSTELQLDLVDYANGDEESLWIRYWHQDTVALILAVIIAVCVIGMLLLFAVPVLAALLSVLGVKIPGFGAVVRWLGSGYKGPILAVTLAVIGLLSLLGLRSRVRSNALLYAAAGCPQCGEQDLIRVRRTRGDRTVARFGIPNRRYVCRNCAWDGLRIGGALPNVEIIQETISTDLLLSNDRSSHDQGTPVQNIPDQDIPDQGIYGQDVQEDEELVTDEMWNSIL